jgi:hypothetical protein
MLQQPNRLSLYKLIDHVAQHGADRIEPFVCMANIRQSCLVEQDLLDDKDGDGFGELRASFHYA